MTAGVLQPTASAVPRIVASSAQQPKPVSAVPASKPAQTSTVTRSLRAASTAASTTDEQTLRESVPPNQESNGSSSDRTASGNATSNASEEEAKQPSEMPVAHPTLPSRYENNVHERAVPTGSSRLPPGSDTGAALDQASKGGKEHLTKGSSQPLEEVWSSIALECRSACVHHEPCQRDQSSSAEEASGDRQNDLRARGVLGALGTEADAPGVQADDPSVPNSQISERIRQRNMLSGMSTVLSQALLAMAALFARSSEMKQKAEYDSLLRKFSRTEEELANIRDENEIVKSSEGDLVKKLLMSKQEAHQMRIVLDKVNRNLQKQENLLKDSQAESDYYRQIQEETQHEIRSIQNQLAHGEAVTKRLAVRLKDMYKELQNSQRESLAHKKEIERLQKLLSNENKSASRAWSDLEFFRTLQSTIARRKLAAEKKVYHARATALSMQASVEDQKLLSAIKQIRSLEEHSDGQYIATIDSPDAKAGVPESTTSVAEPLMARATTETHPEPKPHNSTIAASLHGTAAAALQWEPQVPADSNHRRENQHGAATTGDAESLKFSTKQADSKGKTSSWGPLTALQMAFAFLFALISRHFFDA
eukprot:scaffold992_cov387-Prasinococcus_capsulatus_cf.AAC.2